MKRYVQHLIGFTLLLLISGGGKPSFKSDEAAFRNPDVRFRPVPFWHLNGHLQKDTIVKQISDVKNLCGFGGVTVLPVSAGPQHPTGKPCPGMTPEYLSEEYFDRYTDMLEASKKQGLKLIIYDDVDFPSGTAGGRLRKEYPQYVRKVISKEEHLIVGPAEFARALASSDDLKCMAVSAMNVQTKEIVDLSDAVSNGVLSWNVPEGEWRIMFFNCRYNTNPLVDYMEPEAVAKVLTMTYDEYGKRFDKYFGGVVDKVFFDDVGYVAMEKTWTPAITRLFEEKYGKSAACYYPALYYDIGPETEAARVAFYDLRAELLAEGYPRQIAEWCEAHGLESMGHPPGNYAINSTDMHGDILKFYRHTQVPLADYIFYYGHGRSGFKQVSSAADMYDRPVVGAEVCGAFPADMDSSMLFRVALDLFVRGVNYLVPHGMWYDPDPEHVRIPPLISAYNPRLAPALKRYSDFTARSCMMLQGGRRVADIAVVYPIASAQAFSRLDEKQELGKRGDAAPAEMDYHRLGELLTTALRRDFTLVHPESFLNDKLVREGDCMVLNNEENRQTYKLLIVPGGRVLSAETMGRIRDFYEHGGRVLATSMLPVKSAEFGQDEKLREHVEAVFGDVNEQKQGVVRTSAEGGKALFVSELNVESLEKALLELEVSPDVAFGKSGSGSVTCGEKTEESPIVFEGPEMSIPGEREGSFSYIHKQKDGKDIYLFANSTDNHFRTSVFLRGALSLQLRDPFTGEVRAVESRKIERNGQIYTCFDLDMEAVSGVFVVGIPDN